jgi:hypothetical protein
MASKIEMILSVLDAGGHVMGGNSLTAYHAARKVRNGLMCKEYMPVVRQAVKNFRVRLEASTNGKKIVLSTFDRSVSVEL